MMFDKLNIVLSELDVKIENNKSNPLYSDFVLSQKGKIIGNGWIRENQAEVVGFMGWDLPALNGKLCWTNNRESINHEEYADVVDLFQFAISEDYYWYSPPINHQNAGFSCRPLTDSSRFVADIQLYITNNYNPRIFISEEYIWDWPEME